MIQTAKRMDAFKKSVFTNLKEEAKKYEEKTGKEVIDLSLGSPDIAPEKNVIDVLQKEAGNPANYRYAVVPLDKMLKAIQKWYKKRYEVDLDEDEIVLLQGSQEALVNLPLLYLNPKDAMIIPNPYYPAYKDSVILAEGHVIFAPLLKENNYLIDFDELEKEDLSKAKLILVSYPNNPTGALADDAFYEKLIVFAKKHNLLVIHDNAYSELVFNGKTGKSFLSYEGAKEVGIELNSFSKTYGMAGARLGVMVGNKEVLTAYKNLKSNMDYGIFLPVQYAGIEALKHGGKEIKKTRDAYESRQLYLSKKFTEAGWPVESSEATMFIWAKIPEPYEDCVAFAHDLLEKCGVIVTPGTTFGYEGQGYVRIALVQDESKIKEAAKRLKKSGLFTA